MSFMIKICKSLQTKIRKLIKPNYVVVDGLRVVAASDLLPKDIRIGLYKADYEEPERNLVKFALESSDRVLEIGAGIGLVSLFAARICGTHRLLSYEPNPLTWPIIERNFALNNMKPQLRKKAVSVHAGMVEFYFASNIFSSSMYDRSIGTSKLIESEAISDVINEFQPNVLLLDVEGSEVDLLTEANLSGINKIIVEMHPHVTGADRISSLREHLRLSGFKMTKSESLTELYVSI